MQSIMLLGSSPFRINLSRLQKILKLSSRKAFKSKVDYSAGSGTANESKTRAESACCIQSMFTMSGTEAQQAFLSGPQQARRTANLLQSLLCSLLQKEARVDKELRYISN